MSNKVCKYGYIFLIFLPFMTISSLVIRERTRMFNIVFIILKVMIIVMEYVE